MRNYNKKEIVNSQEAKLLMYAEYNLREKNKLIMNHIEK